MKGFETLEKSLPDVPFTMYFFGTGGREGYHDDHGHSITEVHLKKYFTASQKRIDYIMGEMYVYVNELKKEVKWDSDLMTPAPNYFPN